MNVTSKKWVIGYLILVIGSLLTVAIQVVKVDPFFHYHKPNTEKYYYSLNNQRSQNDGISKNFEYDALITGTSMVENFMTSEMDKIFETNTIKVPYSGATYKEISSNMKNALSSNPNLKIVVCGLDMYNFVKDKDSMRQDLGEYPTYLYDDNILNDVKYVFNRDIIFERVYPMILETNTEGFVAGITTFDDYSNWMKDYTFGVKSIYPDGVEVQEAGEPVYLSNEEREIVLGTVHQNITSLAKEHSDTTFYFFFPPYSIAWWKGLVDKGTIYKQIQAEELVIEELLKYSNIKLYSINNLTNITTDLNNYKDTIHYGSWINSMLLRFMKEEKYLLTVDNYKEYLEKELTFYTTYDYSQLNSQQDYENNYYAEELCLKQQ